jgi:hypothetical protein
MKKLLSLLGAVGLVATPTATVVSCGTTLIDAPTEEEFAAKTYELGDVDIREMENSGDSEVSQGFKDYVELDKETGIAIKIAPIGAMEAVMDYAARNSKFGNDLLAANTNDATDMGELIEFDNTGILDARDGAKVSDETKSNFVYAVSFYKLSFMNFAVDYGNDGWDLVCQFTFSLFDSQANTELDSNF